MPATQGPHIGRSRPGEHVEVTDQHLIVAAPVLVEHEAVVLVVEDEVLGRNQRINLMQGANSRSVLAVMAIVGRTEVIMPTVKQVVGIAIAIALGIVGASAVGVSAIEHSASRSPPNASCLQRLTSGLNDHQRLRKMLLGQEGIGPPLR